jgi:cellulose biosynthesis protein BcsQ
MRTVAFYNLKGGVGKTTSAVNVAYLASQSHCRTLLWDLDPQGSASWYLEPVQTETFKAAKQNASLGRLIEPTPYDCLDLIPSNITMRNMDRFIEFHKQGKDALTNIISPLADTYELTILDCPPNLSALAESVFRAADAILVPLIPTHLSLQTYAQLVTFIAGKKIDVRKLVPFFSMVDVRRKLHRDWVENPPEMLIDLLPVYIPYASLIEKMGERRAPLPVYSPRTPLSDRYLSIWDHITERVKDLNPLHSANDKKMPLHIVDTESIGEEKASI